MSHRITKRLRKVLGVAALSALTLAVFSPALNEGALAYSDKVENACRDDYFRFCPGYPLNSAALRLCMESKSRQLSRSCVNALVSSGEVDRRRVKRGY